MEQAQSDNSVLKKSKPGWFTHKLHEEEEFLVLYRKNDMTFMPTVLEVMVLVLIPWYFAVKYDFLYQNKFHSNLMLIWTILIALFALKRLYRWYMDYYILTSRRLLHVYHMGLFQKHVKETYLDRILNVSFKTTGFISTLFGYGDVSIQAVGMEGQMVIQSVTEPEHVKDTIWNMHLKSGGGSHIVYTSPHAGDVAAVVESKDTK